MISQAEGGVVELDAHTGEVKMLWKTGGASVDAVAVSHDARRVFVSSTESDEVTIIDRLTVVPTRVATGRRPTGLAVTPDGARAVGSQQRGKYDQRDQRDPTPARDRAFPERWDGAGEDLFPRRA